MSGWKNTDAQANNEPSYLQHIGMPQAITNTYSNNTILVTTTRLANSNTTFGVTNKQAPHTGWVHFNHGTGPVVNVDVSNVNSTLVYSNDWLTIVGSNTGSFINAPLVSANAKIVVTGGNTVTLILNSGGSGYINSPVVTSSTSGNANNAFLIFTAKTGGRSNRVKSEVLVALSSPTSANATGAQPWYSGL